MGNLNTKLSGSKQKSHRTFLNIKRFESYIFNMEYRQSKPVDVKKSSVVSHHTSHKCEPVWTDTQEHFDILSTRENGDLDRGGAVH